MKTISLKEVAFMVNLIKANYHRRMNYFYLNVLLFLFPFIFIICYVHKIMCNAEGSIVAICIIISCLSFLKILLKYCFKDESNFPWSIKKRQLTALRETFEGKGEFEDLKNSPQLHEYFDVI